jgi:splicing suppressor protein 51
MASALIAATDKSTMILTIIAALEAAFTDLSTKDTINLHLIGATAN